MASKKESENELASDKKKTDHYTLVETTYGNKTIAISNALIQAREKTSLLESKIELFAVYKRKNQLKTRVCTDSNGGEYNVNYISLTADELRTLTGRTGNSIYNDLTDIALSMQQKVFIYKEPKKNQFRMDSLYGGVEYSNGVMKIDFNPRTEFLFTELSSGYTQIDLGIAFKFMTNGGFQLYKLLKTDMHKLPELDMSIPQEAQTRKIFNYTLSEFRVRMGYVDLNQADIKKEGSKANPDFEKIDNLERKPKFKRFSSFYTRIIAPGIAEVNDISDIYIESIKKSRSGHGKIEGVEICVQWNVDYAKRRMGLSSKPVTEIKKRKPVSAKNVDIFEFIDNLRTFIAENVKIKDLESIAKTAEYDIDLVREAYEAMEDRSLDKFVDEIKLEIMKRKDVEGDDFIEVGDSFIDEIKSIIEETLSDEDYSNIAEAAEGDIEKVKAAYALAKEKPRTNLVGFLITAIKKKYTKTASKATEKKSSDTKKKGDYSQRTYTDEQLKDMELKKLKNSKLRK